MTLRSYQYESPSNCYDAEADLVYVEANLVEILYILGYSYSDLTTITIDEIVGSIREQHPYVRPIEGTTILPASCLLLKERNIQMIMKARRLWHKYTLAKAATTDE